MEPSTLTVGDNVEALSRMDDGSVHLTVTSPPYSDLRDYHGCEWDFDALCVEMMRVLVDGGVVAWVTGDRYVRSTRRWRNVGWTKPRAYSFETGGV